MPAAQIGTRDLTSSRQFKKKSLNVAEAVLGPPIARGQGQDAALLYEDETITYDTLVERANRAGNAYKDLGVSRGDRVLMLVTDTPEFYYTYLGLLKIGAVPVALNLRLSDTELSFIITDSGAVLIVLDAQFLPILRRIESDLDEDPAVVLSDEVTEGLPLLADLMAGASDVLEAVQCAPDDPAFWMYTSGTTGTPKGAVHCQRAIFVAESHLGDGLGVGPGDRVFCSSKLFFAFTLGHCFFAALRLGATVILYRGWPNAKTVADVVEKYRPTVVLSVPTFYRNLLAGGDAGGEAFRQVRHYVSAGEKLPESLFERWRETTGKPLKDGIGSTETAFLFLANRGDEYRPGSCGKPTSGTQVKLLDEDGNPVTDPAVPGILWVKSDAIASGYWNQKKKTREVFKRGWYCTNDMFTRDADGWYRHEGRADDMLKISGQWVSPAEIEDYVLRNPRVEDAAVVGVPNEDGLIRLALFMVAPKAAEDTQSFEVEILETLKSNLSIYKCPRRMFFLDAMPMTSTGKIQRFALRQIAVDAGAPDLGGRT